jgi:hypothetical protein
MVKSEKKQGEDKGIGLASTERAKGKFETWAKNAFKLLLRWGITYLIISFLIYIGLLILYGCRLANAFVIEIIKSYYVIPILLLIIIGVQFIQFNIAKGITDNNQGFLRTGKTIIYILLALTLVFFTFIGVVEKLNINVPPIVSPTPTQTPEISPEIIENTPTPSTFGQLNWCVLPPNTTFPCKYKIVAGDYATRIAKTYYGSESAAGLITEFHRNYLYNDGKIITEYIENEDIILPDVSEQKNESYYMYYYQLLNIPIKKCEGDTFTFPCWYVSLGEEYNVLRAKYDWLASEKCIKDANTVIFNQGTLKPKTPNINDILVLPVCP